MNMKTLDRQALLNAQMRMAIDGYPPSAFITGATTLFLYQFLVSNSVANIFYIQLWLTMQFSLCAIWLFLYVRYHRDNSPIQTIWEIYIEIPLNIFSGLGWGLIWVLFINPDNLNTVILLNVVTSSALFVYIVATPLHPRATNTGLVFCILPILLECYAIGTPLFHWIGIGAIILGFSIYLFGRELHKVYLSNLIQQQENQALIAALNQEKQRVEFLNQEKSRFLAAASHDLRQPAQAIRLLADLLNLTLKDIEQHDLLNKIKYANRSLINTLDPLLELAKLDANVVYVQPTHFYIDDLFFRLQQQYSDLAEAKGIQLRAIKTAQQIFTDPVHLERILGNLIDNAIQHAKGADRILLGLRRRQASIRLEVWDNGVGIPLAQQTQIFQAFYQFNSSAHSKHTGLGLTIVTRLAELIGCQIKLYSIEGKGSCFALDCPF